MSEFSYACGERPQPSPDARDEFVTHRRLINKLLADTTVQQARIAALEEEAGKDRARLSAVEAAMKALGFSRTSALSDAVDRTNADYVPPPTPPSPPCETCGGTRKIDKDWPGEPCGPRMRPCPDCAKPSAPKPEIKVLTYDGHSVLCCGDKRWSAAYGWSLGTGLETTMFSSVKHAEHMRDLLAAEGDLPEVGA